MSDEQQEQAPDAEFSEAATAIYREGQESTTGGDGNDDFLGYEPGSEDTQETDAAFPKPEQAGAAASMFYHKEDGVMVAPPTDPAAPLSDDEFDKFAAVAPANEENTSATAKKAQRATEKAAAKAAKQEQAAQAPPAEKPGKTRSFTTKDGRTIQLRDAHPLGDVDTDAPLATPTPTPKAIELTPTQKKAASGLERAETALVERTADTQVPMASMLKIFDTMETVAIENIRGRVETMTDEELAQAYGAADTTERISWRMRGAVSLQMLTRVKERVAAATGDPLEREQKEMLSVRALAKDLGVKQRTLQNDAKIERTFFNTRSVTPGEEPITPEQIEHAVKVLGGKQFFTEALNYYDQNPQYAVILMAQKKLSLDGAYSTRDARYDLIRMKAGGNFFDAPGENSGSGEDGDGQGQDGQGTIPLAAPVGGNGASASPRTRAGATQMVSAFEFRDGAFAPDTVWYMKALTDASKFVQASTDDNAERYVARGSDNMWAVFDAYPAAPEETGVGFCQVVSKAGTYTAIYANDGYEVRAVPVEAGE